MLEYHVDTNAILVSAYQSRNDWHHISTYNSIMSRLKSKVHIVDLQVLDNEASTEYCCTIVDEWNCTFQIVPPDTHLRNIDKHTICTFKAHFLAILSGVSDSFPNFL